MLSMPFRTSNDMLLGVSNILPSSSRNGDVGGRQLPGNFSGFLPLKKIIRYPRTQCFKDEHDDTDNSLSCSTFNILAPIHKRVNGQDTRESQFKERWVRRNKSILDLLLSKRSSIICLQEFWVQNQELVNMYRKSLNEAGYEVSMLERSNNRGDGLLTAIRNDNFKVVNNRELFFNDCGDRVAQLLHLQSLFPGGDKLEVLVVNTHLIFPHNSSYCLLRLRQVYRIIEYLDFYKEEQNLHSVPVILCGDWNGSKRGHVYKFLCSQGFVSSYDIAHNNTDNDFDAHKWVSHRNHRGDICGVDFIWLLNPCRYRKPLRSSWMESVIGLIKLKLKEAGLKESDAFLFFKTKNNFEDYVTLKDFSEGLEQLGLREEMTDGLTNDEIRDLMLVADLDGNGVIDNQEFQKMIAHSIEKNSMSLSELNSRVQELQSTSCSNSLGRHEGDSQSVYNSSEHENCCPSNYTDDLEASVRDTTEEYIENSHSEHESYFLFKVKEASLFPSEVEQGVWPEDYLMSDHALLTVVFSPSEELCWIQRDRDKKTLPFSHGIEDAAYQYRCCASC